ncbi:hypothetical protein [Bifidobacterium cuniculi]|uniref:Uncharacterized protein n=1 Tax=Bifidobacterium cuniculi TaxID=1688 RepID=A0A087B3W7_9BIFI|nr:hypothetical protein [Bifidobacterium cuniculi]KFI65717.1 hypothetical protein BCUN_0212 [Bifidobacterium cuniculi]
MTDHPNRQNEADRAIAQFDKAQKRQAPDAKYALADEESVRESTDDINKQRRDTAKAQRAEDDNRLRKLMVHWAMRFVGAQLAVCDLVMIGYLIAEICQHHAIYPQVIVAWLGASLVEVIGILWVIARNLFPFHDKNRDKKAERHRKTEDQ